MHPDATLASNRFGLGARPGDLGRDGADARDSPLRALRRPPTNIAGLPHSADVLVEVQALRRQQRAARERAADPVRDYTDLVRRHYSDQVLARYRRAVESDRPFVERLVHFWSNHFALSIDKQPLAALAGLHEFEAIRPNVLGNFRDLLIAAIAHPAMLLYLDNLQSAGEASDLARRAARRRARREFGLNENLAREILELHTLGVDGGYSQVDVVELSRALTGWSVGGATATGHFAEGEPGRFHFRAGLHEPGPRTVLGRRYAADGFEQGRAILRDLAVHPATATHIATKLVRHLVSDQPPARLVEVTAAAFLDADGDLVATYEALLSEPGAWHSAPAKYKTPHELVVSAYRGFASMPDDARRLVVSLDTLGQLPWRPGSPAGWPDTAAEWGGADALYKRIEWADTIARTAGRRVRPVELGEAILGTAFTGRTHEAVARAESTSQGLALLLASPDFQRR